MKSTARQTEAIALDVARSAMRKFVKSMVASPLFKQSPSAMCMSCSKPKLPQIDGSLFSPVHLR